MPSSLSPEQTLLKPQPVPADVLSKYIPTSVFHLATICFFFPHPEKIAFYVVSSASMYSTDGKHDTGTTVAFTFAILINVAVLNTSFCALAVHMLLNLIRTKLSLPQFWFSTGSLNQYCQCRCLMSGNCLYIVDPFLDRSLHLCTNCAFVLPIPSEQEYFVPFVADRFLKVLFLPCRIYAEDVLHKARVVWNTFSAAERVRCS